MAVYEGAAGRLAPLPPSRRPSLPIQLAPDQELALHAVREFMDIFVTLTQGRLASRELPTTIRVLEETAFQRVSDLLQEQGQLCLEICPREVLMLGHSVHLGEAGPGFAGQLYNDGIRQIILLVGLRYWELNELITYLRSCVMRAGRVESDAVITFWEKSWSHIIPMVADPLEAGLIPPPPGEACVLDPGELPALPEAALEEPPARALLEKFLNIVGTKAAPRSQPVQPPGADLQADPWTRGYSLALRLIEKKGSEDQVTRAVIGQVLAQLEGSQWAELSSLGEELFWALGQDAPSDLRWRAKSLREALGQVFDAERFAALAVTLPELDFASFQQLGKLLLVLPHQADAQLLQLMDRTGRGEAAFHLLGILYKRGSEVDWLLKERLGDPDEARALLALESIRPVLSRPAIKALSSLLCHGSARVRRAAMETMGPWLGGAAAQDVIKSMDLAQGEELEASISLLETLPLRPVSKQLLPRISRGRLRWRQLNASQRGRLYKILVRSQDTEAAEYLVTEVTKVNLALGAAGYHARKEVLEAVVEAGGDAARAILLKALDHILLRERRVQLSDALQRVEEGLKNA